MKVSLVLVSFSLASIAQAATFIVDFRSTGSTDIPGANVINPLTTGTNQPVGFIGSANFSDTLGNSFLSIGDFSAVSTVAGNVLSFPRNLPASLTISDATLPAWATKASALNAPSILGPSGGTTTLSFTVGGFTPNQGGIDIDFVSSWLNDAGGNTSWSMTVNGLTSGDSASFNGYTNGRNANAFADLSWTGLSADSSGELSFSISTGDRRISLNAMEITVIPEPSTYALLFGGLALAGCLVRRRLRN